MIPETDDIDCTPKNQPISFFILGEPASKANSRRVVRYGGVSRLIKSEKALSYSEVFRQQCPVITPLLEGDLCVTLHIHYASRRPDLDESLILDLMQDCIYKNDRQVKERHCYWHLDKANPRAEITVQSIGVNP
jgi:Holliday junction resolvase RusA-like endonuclease